MASQKQPFASHRLPLMADESNLLDADNPYSLLELAPPAVRAAIENLPTKFFGYSEKKLRDEANAPAEIARLRMSFWDEYIRASSEQRLMDVRSIVRGVCSHNYFYEKILANQNWTAFITIPPADYGLAIREMLELSWDRIREVLMLPITEKVPLRISERNEETGKMETRYEIIEKPNTKLIGEIRQITNMLDLRVKGAIMQKVQVENRNLNMSVNADDPNVFLADATMAQLDAMEKKIERLRGSMDKVESLNAAEDTEEDNTVEAEDGSNFAEESIDSAAKEDQREKA